MGEGLRLGIETATSPGSVALTEDGRLLAETLLPVRARRSEAVLPEVEALLAACGRRVDALDAVAVGAGPGSFTGVRIAAALAKGLRFARDLPLFAYSSLAVLAAGTGLPGRVCAAFDARRGEVYAAAFEGLEPPVPRVGPAALPVEALLGRFEAPERWTFVGEGAALNAAAIAGVGGRILPPHLGIPRASALLWLARRWPEAGRVADPDGWEPQYVRRWSARPRAVDRATV